MDDFFINTEDEWWKRGNKEQTVNLVNKIVEKELNRFVKFFLMSSDPGCHPFVN